MVKHPFVVGFLVAELPLVEEKCQKSKSDGPENLMTVEEPYSFPPFLDLDKKSREIQNLQVKNEAVGMHNFTSEQRSNAVNISQSLAMAYVMDQVYILHLFPLKKREKKNHYINASLFKYEMLESLMLHEFCGSCLEICIS